MSNCPIVVMNKHIKAKWELIYSRTIHQIHNTNAMRGVLVYVYSVFNLVCGDSNTNMLVLPVINTWHFGQPKHTKTNSFCVFYHTNFFLRVAKHHTLMPRDSTKLIGVLAWSMCSTIIQLRNISNAEWHLKNRTTATIISRSTSLHHA
jgi:hypothetical protein